MSQSPKRPVNEDSPTGEKATDSPKSRSGECGERYKRKRSPRSSHSGEQPKTYKHNTSDSPKSRLDETYKHSSSRGSGSPKNSSRDDRNKRRRSRSPSHTQDMKRSRNDGDRRSRSRSPMPSRRRRNHSNQDKEDPESCKCLGIFGLSLHTNKRQLQTLFSKYGPIIDLQLIMDGQTGRSRGFAFITYECNVDATEAREQCTYRGLEIDGRAVRVDYSFTKRGHSPTPGQYMGQPTFSGGSGRGGGGRQRGGYSGVHRRRSPSPHCGGGPPRRSYRSRSRSKTPRR